MPRSPAPVRPPWWPEFTSSVRSTALTARLGRVLGIAFGICFLTGLLSALQYQPLTWLSYAIDHELFGGTASAFHATNVVLHALTAGVFCLAACRFLRLVTPDPGMRLEGPASRGLVSS